MRPGMGNAEYECTWCGEEKQEKDMASGNPVERTGICDGCEAEHKAETEEGRGWHLLD